MFDGKVKAWRRALHLWDETEVRPDLDPTLRPPPGKGKKRKAEDAEMTGEGDDGKKNAKQKTNNNSNNNKEKEKEKESSFTNGDQAEPLSNTTGDYGTDIPVDYEDYGEEDDDDVL
jgi:hypothetical protein